MKNKINKSLLAEIKEGKETNTIEFKEARGKDGNGKVPKNIYETVCAFSNKYGGNIYLGVKDDGTILGLNKDNLTSMKKDFVTTIQSSIKMDPPLYLDINEFYIDGKYILHVYVPDSSQVHRLNARAIYDRNEDADIDITSNTSLVQKMYNRKQSDYTENKIYKYIKIDDFRSDLIDKVRKAATNLITGENILDGDNDLEILKSLSMYKKDFTTGEEGFTLSSVLIFGKDQLIKSILPYFSVDVLVRFKNTERYDDRLRIQTNLIDSYNQIMNFFAKYISEPFYLEGDKRINVREILMREVLVNLLVHREYSNPFPSRIELRKDCLKFYNANKPVHPGIVKEGDILPYPKNPNIANVFHMLGLVDEIGSGMNKIFKLAPILFGEAPIISNEEHFEVILPVSDKGISNLSIMGASSEIVNTSELSEEQLNILSSLHGSMKTRELFELSDYTNIDSFRNRVLTPLLEKGFIERTIPDKPSSPNQKYRRPKDKKM